MRRRRKEVLLELTPLLDVILIMLFYILMQSTQAAEAKQEEADLAVSAMQEQVEAISESAEAAASEADEWENELLASLTNVTTQIESYEIFDEYALILSIYVTNDGDTRTIHVSDGETDEQIEYDWDDMLYAKNSLKSVLNEYLATLEEDMPAFMVFHYQDDEIYLQDYELIRDVLGDTADGRSYVYIRYDSGEQEESDE